MHEELKTVAMVNDAMSAEMIAGMLRANGIAAQPFGVASSYPSINAVLNSIAVKVNTEDYEAALALIESRDAEEESEAEN